MNENNFPVIFIFKYTLVRIILNNIDAKYSNIIDTWSKYKVTPLAPPQPPPGAGEQGAAETPTAKKARKAM